MSRASVLGMASEREPRDPHKTNSETGSARPGRKCSSHGIEVDPTSQSPDDPIEFCAEGDVAAGNEERANAEPEPAALHAAEVPGKIDPARRRRHQDTSKDE
jgi:hypothetical protein